MPGIRRRLREEHDDDGTMPPADTLEVAPAVDLTTADFFRESLVAVDPMPFEVAARGSAFMSSILKRILLAHSTRDISHFCFLYLAPKQNGILSRGGITFRLVQLKHTWILL